MSSGGSLQSSLDGFTSNALVVPPSPANKLSNSVVLIAEEMPTPTGYTLSCGTAAVFTRRSPIKETLNEDVAALVPLADNRAVLMVADGVGGHASGVDAARLAVTKMVASLRQHDRRCDEEELRTAILNGIESANQAVLELGNGSASTLAIAEIDERVIRTYHVGDSAIMLTGQRGRLKLQTIAHSPVGYAVESGLIDEEDAIHHEDRNVISNVIGASDMRIEIGPPVEMAVRDTLVLASDGLLDNLLPDEIVELARTGPVEQAVARLASEALARMSGEDGETPSKPDDLTIIAFRRRP